MVVLGNFKIINMIEEIGANLSFYRNNCFQYLYERLKLQILPTYLIYIKLQNYKKVTLTYIFYINKIMSIRYFWVN